MRPCSGFNRGYHYILTISDVLSKYAWAVPLKNNDGSETAYVIAKIVRESGRCPKNLQTGKEFYNVDVQKILKKHDVNHYSTYSTLKASVIDSIVRSKMTCGRCYSMAITSCRVSCQIIMRASIGMQPADVTPAIAERLLDTVYSAIKIASPAKFKVDLLRVSKYKTIFEKGYTPNWTTEVFTIIKVQRINPVTYSLEDYREKSVALRARIASRYSSECVSCKESTM